ncbi:MAG: PilW family protein, partial [Bdellovibrionota bacterium]
MPKAKITRKLLDQAGVTLIELMVAVGIGGFLFFALMALLSQTTEFATFFHSAATSIEGTSNAISQLNSIMPQVVRIQSCGCHGVASTNMSSCTWTEPGAADPNIGKDPIQNWGGATGTPGTGAAALGNALEIFKGDFEWFGGDAPNTPLGLITGILTSNINTSGSLGGCEALNGFSVNGAATTTFGKGCKLQIRLLYKAPFAAVGATPSYPGYLRILLGTQSEATLSNGTWIGQADYRGSSALGVTQLSCGYVQSGTTGAQSSGQLFALNLKIKVRATSEQSTSSMNYESWYPGGQNYYRGNIRDLRFKYSFRNLSTRGAYQWRAQGKRNCIPNGSAAVNKSDCCSLARN